MVIQNADAVTRQSLQKTKLPVKEFSSAFVGWSLERVAAWYLDNAELPGNGLWLVLDDQGLREKEVVLFEKVYEGDDDDDDEEEADEGGDDAAAGTALTDDPASPLMKFRMARVAYGEVNIMLANLSIANMSFGEYVGADDGAKPGRMYLWQPFPDHPQGEVQELYDETARAVKERLDAVLGELEKGGWIV